MRGPDGDAAQEATETLQVGAARPASSRQQQSSRRQLVTVVLAFSVGVIVGGGALLWWQGRPGPPTFRGDEHAVELVLFAVATTSAGPGPAEPRRDQLLVEGGLLLSGSVTSTVLRISTPGRALDVRVPALPVTVSPTRRYRSVGLRLVVRDCPAASRWQVADDRPFTITWRDEDGRVHLDRAGDSDDYLAGSLARFIDSSCAGRGDG